MKTKRIKIMTDLDRPHITYDILSVLYNHNIEILMMEVYTYVIYLKTPFIEKDLWDKTLIEFQKIEGFESVEEIDLIAFEERDIEMKRVLDAIPQGVIVLNGLGKIKYANTYVSERIFKTTFDELVNKHISMYIEDNTIDLSFKPENKLDSVRNKEVNIGNQFYTLNLNVLLSDENVFTGYMIFLSRVADQNMYFNHITFEDIIGESNKIHDVVNQAKIYSESDSPVLITGESGTGKELFARSIHNQSDRKKCPFIAINCAAMPEQLLESELFGYEGGSFTGGKKQGKKGIFEIGDGGTIFLDEIADMAPHLQSKLLRVLQERSIRRIGGSEEIPTNVRIISATNKDIKELIQSDKFRLDLFYRINIFSVDIPSLRERKEDIPILVEYFVGRQAKRYGKEILSVKPGAMDKLLNYSWPGNIRELQNVIERAVALSDENGIKEEDIVINHGLEDIVVDSEQTSLKGMIGQIERKIVLDALRNSSSIREASRKLDVTHTLLINRIKKYDILDKEWKSY